MERHDAIGASPLWCRSLAMHNECSFNSPFFWRNNFFPFNKMTQLLVKTFQENNHLSRLPNGVTSCQDFSTRQLARQNFPRRRLGCQDLPTKWLTHQDIPMRRLAYKTPNMTTWLLAKTSVRDNLPVTTSLPNVTTPLLAKAQTSSVTETSSREDFLTY